MSYEPFVSESEFIGYTDVNIPEVTGVQLYPGSNSVSASWAPIEDADSYTVRIIGRRTIDTVTSPDNTYYLKPGSLSPDSSYSISIVANKGLLSGVPHTHYFTTLPSFEPAYTSSADEMDDMASDTDDDMYQAAADLVSDTDSDLDTDSETESESEDDMVLTQARPPRMVEHDPVTNRIVSNFPPKRPMAEYDSGSESESDSDSDSDAVPYKPKAHSGPYSGPMATPSRSGLKPQQQGGHSGLKPQQQGGHSGLKPQQQGGHSGLKPQQKDNHTGIMLSISLGTVAILLIFAIVIFLIIRKKHQSR